MDRPAREVMDVPTLISEVTSTCKAEVVRASSRNDAAVKARPHELDMSFSSLLDRKR